MPASKRAMDFTNVKEQGLFNPRHRKAGDYVLKITAVDDHTSKDSNEGWVFTCVIRGETNQRRPATYPYYCGSDAKQAWKIRKLFIACGVPVPKKRVLVDPNKLLNKTFGAALDDDEYEGKLKSVIIDTFPKEDVSTTAADDDEDDAEYEEEPDDEEEEEAPPPRRAAKKTAAKKAPAKKSTSRRRAPEPEDDEDEEDIDDLDLEEL